MSAESSMGSARPEASSAETGSSPVVAAVDLGSNSFHLIVAQSDGTRLQVIDKIKEPVRIAAGLDASNRLQPEAEARAHATLERFGERLREVPAENIRAVGTNTLRKARDSGGFLQRAQAALGHEIEILSGREEARLIYLGVAHALEDDHDQRLVVDVGGGSTELILGRGVEPTHMESLYMGCVDMTNRFFPRGTLTASALEAAQLAAHQELEPIVAGYRAHSWDTAIGASGTILATQQVVAALGWSQEAITWDALGKLQDALIRAGHIGHLDLPGLSARRAEVFPGGMAILSAIFSALGIARMRPSTGALREGLLWDLLGRQHQADIRERTVADLGRRHHIDTTHAAQIQTTALELLAVAGPAWGETRQDDARLLGWAAWLHEVGLDIAHTHYHKHGHYLLEHTDMPGFSRTEQAKLALLVRAHRRKFPFDAFAALEPESADTLGKLALLLRCAAVLHRGRAPGQAPELGAIEADRGGMQLVFPPYGLHRHPLTRLDLAAEAKVWETWGMRLSYSDADELDTDDARRTTRAEG